LTKVDRSSMANSLEVRVPLLDHEFMELVATMPSSFKLKGKEGKYLLKRSLEPFVPGSILYRPKMGFRIPLGHWLRSDLREIFMDTVLHGNGSIGYYLNLETVAELWTKHQSGESNFAYELWSILFFACWSRRFL
jgi:asparagine synthase (glutamine-hydrolysing)